MPILFLFSWRIQWELLRNQKKWSATITTWCRLNSAAPDLVLRPDTRMDALRIGRTLNLFDSSLDIVLSACTSSANPSVRAKMSFLTAKNAVLAWASLVTKYQMRLNVDQAVNSSLAHNGASYGIVGHQSPTTLGSSRNPLSTLLRMFLGIMTSAPVNTSIEP